MADTFIMVIMFLFELFFDLLFWFPWDFGITIKDHRSEKTPEFGVWIFLSLVIGIVLGAASTLLVAEYFIGNYWIRVLHLITSPFIAGAVATKIAKLHQTKYDPVNIPLHYWCAFIFVLSFGLIRLLLIRL